MQLVSESRRLAAVGGVLLGIGILSAIAPHAANAGLAVHECANTVERVTIPGEAGRPSQTFSVPVKAISASGLSCTAAYRFLAKLSSSATVPEGYTCRPAHFKAPKGYVATACTKHGKRVQYAEHGG